MQYDFDTPIDRTHTWSIKHDFKKENGKADDIQMSRTLMRWQRGIRNAII